MLYVLLKSMQAEVLSSRESLHVTPSALRRPIEQMVEQEVTAVVRAYLLDRRSTATMPESQAATYDLTMHNSNYAGRGHLAHLCSVLGMSCVNGSRREVLGGIVRSSQGLVVRCKKAGIMVAQGMLLSQVVVLLVNA